MHARSNTRALLGTHACMLLPTLKSVALTEKMKAQTEEADTTAMQLAEKNKHELQTTKSRIQQLESEAAEAGTKLSALEK